MTPPSFTTDVASEGRRRPPPSTTRRAHRRAVAGRRRVERGRQRDAAQRQRRQRGVVGRGACRRHRVDLRGAVVGGDLHRDRVGARPQRHGPVGVDDAAQLDHSRGVRVGGDRSDRGRRHARAEDRAVARRRRVERGRQRHAAESERRQVGVRGLAADVDCVGFGGRVVGGGDECADADGVVCGGEVDGAVGVGGPDAFGVCGGRCPDLDGGVGSGGGGSLGCDGELGGGGGDRGGVCEGCGVEGRFEDRRGRGGAVGYCQAGQREVIDLEFVD